MREGDSKNIEFEQQKTEEKQARKSRKWADKETICHANNIENSTNQYLNEKEVNFIRDVS